MLLVKSFYTPLVIQVYNIISFREELYNYDTTNETLIYHLAGNATLNKVIDMETKTNHYKLRFNSGHQLYDSKTTGDKNILLSFSPLE